MIIKNCPASSKDFRLNCQGKAYVYKYNCVYGILECKDVTDCILKKIYENLKQVAISGQCDNCDGLGYYNGCGDTECGMYQALKSIELLEIEESENND